MRLPDASVQPGPLRGKDRTRQTHAPCSHLSQWEPRAGNQGTLRSSGTAPSGRLDSRQPGRCPAWVCPALVLTCTGPVGRLVPACCVSMRPAAILERAFLQYKPPVPRPGRGQVRETDGLPASDRLQRPVRTAGGGGGPLSAETPPPTEGQVVRLSLPLVATEARRVSTGLPPQPGVVYLILTRD
uniref:Uncharacterized protein n=1 Tax=Myotis myotis TaxID=51298 RepID=A0A7J7SRC3_MYOMY|nr:hypothetical protein mMyoMyo1_009289 [Myotis myotis]